MKKKSFTILEMVISLMIFGLLFSAVMTIYTRMINVKKEFDARNYLLNTTYTILERMNIMLKDYTIDYEEYFNRRMVGCQTAVPSAADPDFVWTWSVGTTGYCAVWDGYGNSSSITTPGVDTTWHVLYGCSSTVAYDDNTTLSYVYPYYGAMTTGQCLYGSYQSFGQYRRQFIDVMENADETPSPIGDDDDTDSGAGPEAIEDNENVPELYLISKDKKSRLFFRRKMISQSDANNNGTIEPYERLYVLQMLQLRGFDAGTKHSFNPADPANLYMYDGQVDTWACDYEKGFLCNGADVNTTLYSGYKLPANEEDGRVNLFGGDVTISDWRLQIFPVKDPVYAWAEDEGQVNPYVRVILTTHLYAPARSSRINIKAMDAITYDLQTMFNIKSNY